MKSLRWLWGGIAALVLSWGGADAEIYYDGVTGADISAMLDRASLPHTDQSRDGMLFIVSESETTKFTVVGFNCQDGGTCASMIFEAYWLGAATPEQAERINDFNESAVFGRGFVSSNQEITVDLATDVSGGVSLAHLDRLLGIWTGWTLPDFKRRLWGTTEMIATSARGSGTYSGSHTAPPAKTWLNVRARSASLGAGNPQP